MLKNLYYRSNEILFYLFPISIVFSNFIANFIVYYLAIYGIIILINNKYSFYKNQVIYILIFFWFYISVRSLFTTEILYSLKSSLLLVRYLLFFIAVTVILKSDRKIIKKFTIYLSIFFTILFVDSFYEFYNGKNLFGSQDKISYRISSFFSGRFVLGSYVYKMGLLWIILLNYLFFSQKSRVVFFILSFISLIVVLLSGDRAALGLFLLSLLTIVFLDSNDVLNFKKILIFLSLITILTIAILFSDSFKHRFYYKTLHDLKSADKIYFFSKGHQSHWETSIKMFDDNKIFGKGPNMFRKLCDNPKFNSGPKSCSTHPHNYYIQLLGETGLIGFALISFIYILIIYELIKQFFYIYIKKTNF